MILTTERLEIRDFEERDWKPTLEYQSDPDFLHFNPWTHRTEADVRSLVRMFINWGRERPRRKFQLAIILKSERRLIGNCGLRMSYAQEGIADLGYELDRHYWGHGYATEASRALLQFGFEQLHLHRIWAYCLSENVASAHVLEKIGMRFEGAQLESEWMKERWWNTLFYAMLEREWLSLCGEAPAKIS
ncbi:GNAT family N-acetyltransferase [Dictyobacter arantiisoli]|uniref:Ribosomal-protein-serine acetyltransferase n=1 Tax=Dictyobacter arantiisoli TaxID=2014874 RepID=A0A5A5T5Y5_9CHLR|nr:GNAT family N-acetyltransferase [Dictyobacter arantiisoli]GCF06850.1 ribosomal-protein-serine acetyltransferase [Dictyobacter arantiisoli]